MEATKKRQTTLSFLTQAGSELKPPVEKKKKLNSRKLQLTTAQKWVNTTLAKYNANEWLEILYNGNYVTALQCTVCRQYTKQIDIYKGYTPEWGNDEGSCRIQHSAAVDHANGLPHQRAYELAMKSKGMDVSERNDKLSNLQKEMRQTDILSGLKTMTTKDLNLTKKKFELAYFIAKEELPLSVYPKILRLEENHGVEFGQAYRNKITCGTFIDYIGLSLSNILRNKLKTRNYFSILIDASTDVSAIEKEAIFIISFDPTPIGKTEICVECSFLFISDLEHGTSEGVFNKNSQSLESEGIENFKTKLVGFGADGAAVNRGSRTSVNVLLQKEIPWVTFGWCVAHRLELALKNKFAQMKAFNDVNNIILKMYNIYKKSPKKLRQLGNLVAILEEGNSFDIAGIRPKKASGTRWIAHKIQALEMILDKYRVYMKHLENMTADFSFTQAERAKFKGYHQQWNHGRIPLYIALFIEVLSPAKLLSLSFQSNDIDSVASSGFIEQTKKQLSRLKKKEFNDLPTVKRFLAKVKNNTGKYSFQDVELHDFTNALTLVKNSKSMIVSLIAESIEERLETQNTVPDMYGMLILNTGSWFQNNTNNSFADDNIEKLYDFYNMPLRNAGFTGSVNNMLDAWHNLVDYTVKYLAPDKTEYRKVWYQIFSSSMKKDWSPVLLLVELLFVLPVSNGKVERLFSLMNRIKTDTRNRLTEKRLNNLIRVCTDETNSGEFDVNPAIELWAEDTLRRPTQESRKTYSKKEKKKTTIKTLIDLESSSDESLDLKLSFDETLDNESDETYI
ncbi:zinc finger protein 862-like [Hydra vulgaris]|uniref:Zinc finger protein 862-like n=1 Tax=Hydra vulgaris TaxID=6087 RepID=A0ABM4D0U8_HYDVU